MNKLVAIVAGVLVLASGHANARSGFSISRSPLSRPSTGDHYTKGYVKRDGTYVNGFHATNPNGTRNDNYSTRGNLNPYTGAIGTKPRDEDFRGGYVTPRIGLYGSSVVPRLVPKLAPNPDLNAIPSVSPSYAYPSAPIFVCSHEQLVEARLARLNGYTGGPKCD